METQNVITPSETIFYSYPHSGIWKTNMLAASKLWPASLLANHIQGCQLVIAA